MSLKHHFRQGGVLSPFLFNLYVDELIYELEASDAGCCVCGKFFGCIMYADDLLLLSASVSGLQYMLDICYKFGVENDIIFNQKKSVCIRIGPHWNKPISPMVLGNMSLDWASSFKYLGINFFSGLSLKVDICCIKRAFYKAINGILSYCKTADEFVKLGLVKAYCLPLLTYCIGAIDLPASSVKDLAVCWNDCFRKVFGYKRYESVKELQFFCGELPFDLIYNLQRWKFLSSDCVVCDISVLYKLQAHVVGDLSHKFGVARSVCQMKHLVRDFFSMSHN